MSHYRVWAAFDVSVVTRQTILFRNWWCFIASAPQETPRFCIQHLVNPSLPFNTGTGGKTCIYYLFRLYVHSILKGQTGRELKRKKRKKKPAPRTWGDVFSMNFKVVQTQTSTNLHFLLHRWPRHPRLLLLLLLHESPSGTAGGLMQKNREHVNKFLPRELQQKKQKGLRRWLRLSGWKQSPNIYLKKKKSKST